MEDDKRHRILEAALKVISKNKLAGTRMHLIAQEAGVSQSILHYYFKSKKDLLNSLLVEINENFNEQRKELVELAKESFNDSLKRYFSQKKNLILNHKEIDIVQMDFWVLGTVYEEINPQMKNLFSSWRNSITESLREIAVMEGKSDKYINILPIVIVSVMIGATLQYLMDEGSFDIEKYFNVAENMISKFIKKL
jgi:TetR/AcrR family transcriptional regulator